MKILATDYDGTVTPEGITPAFRAALDAWRAAGNLFGVVTGRPRSSIADTIYLQNFPVDFVIADNGAVICGSDMQPVLVKPVRVADVKSIIGLATGIKTSFFRLDSAMAQFNTTCLPGYTYADEETNTLFFDTYSMKDPTEVCIRFGTSEENFAIQNRIGEVTGGRMHGFASNPRLTDAVAAGVDKCSGILDFVGMLDKKPETIYTTGDAWNDLAMLTRDGFEGYCVATGQPEVIREVGRTVKSPRELMEKFL